MPPQLSTTERSRLRRHPERAQSDRTSLHAVLDEGLVCHVGLTTDEGTFVIPTSYARDGETLLLHGSPASRLLRNAASGVELCCTVTLVDGLVLARSAFHHSVNYRCAVVLGRAAPIVDLAARAVALRAIVEHLVPGRSAGCREPSAQEVRSTLVLALALDEASVKVRSGAPVDDEADLGLGVWAGTIPLTIGAGTPVPAVGVAGGPPRHVAGWSRG